MKETKKGLAEFLKKNRILSGLTQGEVAQVLGYSTPQFVSNWERGLSHPPIFVLRRLAELYNVPADAMFKEILKATISQVEQNLHKQFYKRARGQKKSS